MTAATSTVSLKILDEITMAKTLAMLLLGSGSFVLGILPIKLVKRWQAKPADIEAAASKSAAAGHSHHHGAASSSPVVTLLLCFGGGALLFTVLFHMWPEVRQGVRGLQKAGMLPGGFRFVADLIVLAGIPLSYFLDKIVHFALDECTADSGDETEALLHRSSSQQKCTTVSELRSSLDGSLGCVPSACDPGGQAKPTNVGRSFRGLFTVIALSLHEMFEGFAIGLEERVENVWYLFIAVATHELVIAFCVGLDLAWSRTRVSAIVMYVTAIAVITPVGIAVGMCLVKHNGSPGTAAVVLQGLAIGTLLYVVIFEIIPTHYRPGYLHPLAILAGFCVMFALQLTTHKHSHGSLEDHHQHIANVSISCSS